MFCTWHPGTLHIAAMLSVCSEINSEGKLIKELRTEIVELILIFNRFLYNYNMPWDLFCNRPFGK